MPEPLSQRRMAHTVLKARGIARLAELRAEGVTAATLSRMERDGEVLRLARGLYQLSDAPLDAHHSLAEAAKRVPKGVVCLVSALAFHQLTDQLPRQVWIAIGQKIGPPRLMARRFGWCASRTACSRGALNPIPSRACP